MRAFSYVGRSASTTSFFMFHSNMPCITNSARSFAWVASPNPSSEDKATAAGAEKTIVGNHETANCRKVATGGVTVVRRRRRRQQWSREYLAAEGRGEEVLVLVLSHERRSTG